MNMKKVIPIASTLMIINIINDEGVKKYQEASMRKQQQDIMNRREVLKRIIDVIRYLCQQALPLRGHHQEAAYTLNQGQSDNHGNFLELILLLAKYDPVVAAHVKTVQKKSGKRIQELNSAGKTGSRGRGSLVTFFSKTTINVLIKIMKDMIQEQIAAEIKRAKYFSIQVDSTQDITSVDNFSIVIRYVLEGKVYERILAVVPSTDGSGQGLF